MPASENIGAGKAQQTSNPVPSLQTTQPVSEEPVRTREVHFLDERVQQDADLQVKWASWMSDVQKNSFYKSVCVLLLSWHPDYDDLSVGDEVQRLGAVFENDYHYSVTSVLIDPRDRNVPQVQANYAVSDFVRENDWRDDALLIVYYAGHGSPGKDPGQLKWSGRRRKTKFEPEKFHHITWNYVESLLKDTQADVFLIFDCCSSSDLGRGTSLSSRSFEYLAASSTYYTPSPGERSFTSALIWALKKLANPDPSSRTVSAFTTTRLAREISTAPGFPQDQTPSLTSRDVDSIERIKLAPLALKDSPQQLPSMADQYEDENDEDDEECKEPEQCLSLTFHFKPKQTEQDFKRLADHLKKYMIVDGSSLKKVQWAGIGLASKRPLSRRWRFTLDKIKEQSPLQQKNKPFPRTFVSIHDDSSRSGEDSSSTSLRALSPALDSTPVLPYADSDTCDESVDETVLIDVDPETSEVQEGKRKKRQISAIDGFCDGQYLHSTYSGGSTGQVRRHKLRKLDIVK